MPHLHPPSRESLAEFEAVFSASDARQGYVATSLYMLGWRPEILKAFLGLFGAVMRPGAVEAPLKRMLAQVASTASGCRYCQAHTASAAADLGVPAEKVAALYEFESSPHFTEAERAALRLGRDAAIQPNAVTEEHFTELKRHFDEPQIVELLSAAALFGFLNRWNDSMATELEDVPLNFAAQHLAEAGWEAGKHRS